LLALVLGVGRVLDVRLAGLHHAAVMREVPRRWSEAPAHGGLGGRLRVGAMAALVGLGLLAAGCTENRTARVKTMLAALRAGDYPRAYSCCTVQDFRAKVSLERFQTVLAEVPIERSTASTVKFREKFGEHSAIVDAELATPQGPVKLTFYVYRPILENDYLVGQLLVNDSRLFAGELGAW
jgi:hypothetical protein